MRQVARELGVRYVLEGSVRKAGNRVRITGQLINSATGAHLWADRFDGSLDDIFDLQDQVASRVVGVIEPRLRLTEIDRASRKPTESLDAYDLYLRAMAREYKRTEEAAAEFDPAGPPRARTRSCLCSGHGEDCRFADMQLISALDPGVGHRSRRGDPHGAAGARSRPG